MLTESEKEEKYLKNKYHCQIKYLEWKLLNKMFAFYGKINYKEMQINVF